MTIQRLTDATFDDVVHNTSHPIFVVFTAPKRCELCRVEKPILDQLAEEGVPVFAVDVEQEDSQNIERVLGGRGVPYHKIFHQGLLVREFLGGPMTIQDLRAFWNGTLPLQDIPAEKRTPTVDA